MSDGGARIVPGAVLKEGGVVVRRRSLEELDRGRRAVTDAEQRARSILEKAHTEADTERERGYAEGLARAREQNAAQAVALRAEAVKMRADAGERLIRLAVELTQRVLHRELQLRPDTIEELAKSALAQVSWCRQVTLRLHPDDVQRLSAAHPGLVETLDPGAELRLEPDPELRPGDCLVETEAGDVNASVPVQLAALQRALLEEVDS